MDGVFDVAIIGSGPGGLQSAIYCGSEGLRTIVVEMGKIGGQIADTPKLENFAGQSAKGVSGPTFTRKMREQAESFGVTFVKENVVKLERRINLVIRGESEAVKARSAIIATGATYIIPEIEGLKDVGNKVHIGPFNCMSVKEKPRSRFIVIGGGNSAGQCALHLAQLGETQMYIRHSLKTSLYLTERLKANKHIVIRENSTIAKVQKESGILLCQLPNGMLIHCDHLYLCAGNKPNSEFVNKVYKDDNGFIKTDEKFETNERGIFAIGDVRSGVARRSVANAIGEASSVTAHVHNYLQSDKAPRSTAD